MTVHYTLTLPRYPRGYHLVTELVFQAVSVWPENGILHVFIKHTSAALTINENADSSVRRDFEKIFNRLVPENLPGLEHDVEGPDDMPAHIKAAMIGNSVTLPVIRHKPVLGTWQGIYLCEFRNQGGARQLIISVQS